MKEAFALAFALVSATLFAEYSPGTGGVWGFTAGYVAPSSSFTPSSLPSLTLWLDGTDNSTITGSNPVTQWKDKSPNAKNWTNSNSPTVVSNGINGKQVISVSSSLNVLGDGTGTTIISSASGFYVYVVLKNTDGTLQSSGLFTLNLHSSPAAASPYFQFSGGGAPFNAWMWFAGEATAGWTNNGPCIPSSASNPFATATNPYDIGVESTNGFATLANFSIYVNGVAQTVANVGANGGAVDTVNSKVLGGNNVPVYIGEVVAGSQALNGSQRTSLQNYLSRKWGV